MFTHLVAFVVIVSYCCFVPIIAFTCKLNQFVDQDKEGDELEKRNRLKIE